MNYRVGQWRYRVRVVEEPIKVDGASRMGLCCEAAKEIHLSPDCPPQSRWAVLLHELVHAWVFHTGEPAGLEDWCDLIATLSASALDDLAINGGKESLFRLSPGESPAAGSAKIALTRNRYCGKCQSTIAGFSVECRPSTLPGVLDLSLYCEHCNHTQHWREMATATGLPSGTPIGEASYQRTEGSELTLVMAG